MMDLEFIDKIMTIDNILILFVIAFIIGVFLFDNNITTKLYCFNLYLVLYIAYCCKFFIFKFANELRRHKDDRL